MKGSGRNPAVGKRTFATVGTIVIIGLMRSRGGVTHLWSLQFLTASKASDAAGTYHLAKLPRRSSSGMIAYAPMTIAHSSEAFSQGEIVGVFGQISASLK